MADAPDIDDEELALEIAERYSISLKAARQVARYGLRSFSEANE